MKKKKLALDKKMILDKKTIAELRSEQQDMLAGGISGIRCTLDTRRPSDCSAGSGQQCP
ncbi:MAG TPA: class I lanthipeptide [Chitinophaga sp.]|uniref:class I lanthipeptide n=1 Tax=Chitinophaga sp. TaxID=1869181 RepID=UPI002CE39764|nr:class I lanthipeptide [Chitinophaga sp.]HVI46102.1 class I lanthipeptide [Chitinophaga sp.]